MKSEKCQRKNTNERVHNTFFQMISFVFLFILSVSSYENGVVYNWDGLTYENKIYLVTSDGYLYYIDFINGKILWSIETGGDVCSSISSAQTTYVPSIDGFMYTYSPDYGFQKMALSIKELVFTAPFRTRSGEIFSSGKQTTIFTVDPSDGSIINVQSSNTSLLNQYPNIKEKESIKEEDYITIIRIDYELTVYNQNSQLVRYSEFQIFSQEDDQGGEHVLYNLDIETQFSGLMLIRINESKEVHIQIPGVVTGVYGSEEKFNYQILGNDSDSDVMFLTDKSLAIPSKPTDESSDTHSNTGTNEVDDIQKDNNNVQDMPNENNLDEYTPGFHEIKTEYASFQKLPNLPKETDDEVVPQTSVVDDDVAKTSEDQNEYGAGTNQVTYTYISFSTYNFIMIPTILVLLYFGVRIVLFLVARLMKVERKLDPIVIDKYDSSKGTSGGRKLTLVHRKTINAECLKLSRSVGLLDNTAKLLKDETRENEIIIGYQQLDNFDFEHMDGAEFLTRMLGALKSIFAVGLVHGSIAEEVIYSDGGKATLAGLEWSCTKTNDPKLRGKDMRDTAKVVIRTYTHFKIPITPLLQDILSDLENDDPMEIPTPEEALKHPLFWSLQEKTKLYYLVNDELSSASPSLIQEFENHRIEVIQCTSWLLTLPKPLINDLKSRGDYAGDSLRDLVRMIRNKIEHSSETPKKLVEFMGATKEEVFQYFDTKFPNLFLYSYYFYQKYHN